MEKNPGDQIDKHALATSIVSPGTMLTMSPKYIDAETPNLKSQCRDSSIIKDIQEESSKPGCSIWMMVLLSGPKLAASMAWAAQYAGVTPYLEGMLPSYAVQITSFIGPVSGIIVAPTIGVLTEQCTSKWGRRRPFILFGAIASAICWTLMGFTKEIGEALGDHGDAKTGSRFWTAFMTICLYTWMDITVNVVQAPAQLLISDFVGDRQTTGSAIGQAAAVLGAFMVALYIQVFGPAHQHLKEFLAMLSVIMLLTTGVTSFVAKEIPLVSEEKESSSCKKIGNAFRSIYTGIKRLSKNLWVFCLIFFLVQYGFTSYNGAKTTFFGVNIYGGEKLDAGNCASNCTREQDLYNEGVKLAGGTTDLIFCSFGYLFSWTIPYFVSKLNAKRFLTLCLIPQILFIVMAVWKVNYVALTIVVLAGITQNTMYAMIVPVILHDIGGTNDGRLGLYLGAVNSANCAGQFMNFVISSGLVTSSMGYALPILVGGIFSALAAGISLIWFKAPFKQM